MIALPPRFLSAPLAHRGLHDKTKKRPENSPAAFDAAIAAGYGIELDVQLSADGRAMVFHDETLDRLTYQSGPVRGKTAAVMDQIKLRHGNDTIPTLEKVLRQVKGRVPVLIEIKDQDGALGPKVGALEADVARCLENYSGQVAVMSFNPHSVAAFSDIAPSFAVGLVTDPFDAADWPGVPPKRCRDLAAIPDFSRLGLSFISHNVADLKSPHVARVKAAGGRILCWTVRSADQEREARQIVDNITFEGYAAPLP